MVQIKSLIAQGAQYVGDDLLHYGNAVEELQFAQQGNIIAHLSHLSLLQIEGEDSLNFLQGQLTNDIRLLDGKQTQYAGYCTPKGRMLALFLAFAHAGHYHLLAPAAQTEALIKRLRMFILRSKVTIQEKPDVICLGLAGAQVESVLKVHFGEVPQQAHSMVTLNDVTLIRLPSDHPMWLLFTAESMVEEVLNKLIPTCTPVGKAAWESLQIQAALPQVVPATQEAFVPQMLNLDVLNGISFKKGCYTGQEIVARTHYLGSVKRRMQRAYIASTTEVIAGDKITVAGSDDAVGMVVNAAPALDGGTDVLVEIRLDHVSETQVVECHQQRLHFRPLPYQLP